MYCVKCEEYFKYFFALWFLCHFNLCSDFKNFVLNSETLFVCFESLKHFVPQLVYHLLFRTFYFSFCSKLIVYFIQYFNIANIFLLADVTKNTPAPELSPATVNR